MSGKQRHQKNDKKLNLRAAENKKKSVGPEDYWTSARFSGCVTQCWNWQQINLFNFWGDETTQSSRCARPPGTQVHRGGWGGD